MARLPIQRVNAFIIRRFSVISHRFRKNYTFAKQNEVQEAHWHSLSVTILVQIIYRLNPTTDPNRKKTQLLKEIHFYISNDGKRDTLFVQHRLLLHWNHMTKGGFIPTKQYV
jgi:hypothetical protein